MNHVLTHLFCFICQDTPLCEHPLSDITIAGRSVDPLPHAFHMLLQTIADVTMLLPLGSAIQQMAIRCFCLKFRQSDHQFLHESHVFSNISQILSQSDELMEQGNGEVPKVRFIVNQFKTATLKKTKNWFSRPIIA